MKLNEILSGQMNAAEWEAKGYELPKFDIKRYAKRRPRNRHGCTSAVATYSVLSLLPF